MANPMLQVLNGASARPSNNPMQMLQQFAAFKRQMQGKNPEAIVKDLLASGKMTQEQFDNLKRQAQSLQNFLK